MDNYYQSKHKGRVIDEAIAYVIDKLPGILKNKVNSESGKGLSTNDYTQLDKEKVSHLPNDTSEELKSKANKADTLEGYGIKDAVKVSDITEDELDELTDETAQIVYHVVGTSKDSDGTIVRDSLFADYYVIVTKRIKMSAASTADVIYQTRIKDGEISTRYHDSEWTDWTALANNDDINALRSEKADKVLAFKGTIDTIVDDSSEIDWTLVNELVPIIEEGIYQVNVAFNGDSTLPEITKTSALLIVSSYQLESDTTTTQTLITSDGTVLSRKRFYDSSIMNMNWSKFVCTQNIFKNDTGGYELGEGASAGRGIAFGNRSKSTAGGVALGNDSDSGKNGVAIGEHAVADAEDAVQIGSGTNTRSDTVQFFDKTIMDEAGNIPPERLSCVMPRAEVSGYPIKVSDSLSGTPAAAIKVFGTSTSDEEHADLGDYDTAVTTSLAETTLRRSFTRR